MADLFGKMAEMQKQMASTQEQLGKIRVLADAGGGMVKVTATGAMRIVAIEVERELLDANDQEMLQDLIVAGVNKALDAATKAAQEQMRSAAGSMLPEGLDLSQLGL